MKKYSFGVGGFCFHLTQVVNNEYEDQTGMRWYKNGDMFISSAGGYSYKIRPEDCLSNKDYSHMIRQGRTFSQSEREQYYSDRLRFMKS